MARTKVAARNPKNDGGKVRHTLVATQKIVPLVKGKGGKKPLGPGMGGIKKPHRFRPGVQSMREIRRQQKSVDMLLKNAPFNRLVDEIRDEMNKDVRIAKGARDAWKEMAQAELIKILGSSYNVSCDEPRPATSRSPTLLARHMVTALNVTREHPGDSGYTKYEIHDRQRELRLAKRDLGKGPVSSLTDPNEPKKARKDKKKKTASVGRDSSVAASTESFPVLLSDSSTAF